MMNINLICNTYTQLKYEEYIHAIKKWNTFKLKNVGEYHDLYLKSEVLFLAYSTFIGTSNKAMFHWRSMQLGGPIEVRYFLVVVRQFSTQRLHKSIMGIDHVFR